jgi:Zn-dependent M28 family amino/carboxypeptidase
VKTTIVILAIVIVVAVVLFLVMKMPGHSFAGRAPALDAAQTQLREALRRDVAHLAGTIGERNVVLEKSYAQAADFIEQSFRAAGYATERQTYVVDGVTCANVIAERRGASDGIVVIGAHYDTVDGSPGADDNTSGVAAMLALARHFATSQPRRTLRFVAFANEEPPYFMTEEMGSYVYAKRCRERHEKVVAMLSLETIGYYRDEANSQQYPAGLEHVYPTTGNFITFTGNLASRRLLHDCIGAFRAHATIPSEGGALPEGVPGVAWSDQWSFWRFDYPAIMVTDTAPYRNHNYHRASDTPETLDYDRFARVVNGLGYVVTALAK